MSEYINNAVNACVWTTTCPELIREARTKGRITTLIYLSKRGDTKASERLLDEFTPTLEMLAKDMLNRNNPNSDLRKAIQVAREAFESAVLNYDHRGQFEPHMKIYVISELSKFLTQ